MPAGDGRGPNGAGSMTGRGLGLCAGYSMPGYANTGRGGSRGGMGRRNRSNVSGRSFYGRGFQGTPDSNRYEAPNPRYEYSADLEIRMLREQAESLKKEAEYIDERIRELESASAEKTGR